MNVELTPATKTFVLAQTDFLKDLTSNMLGMYSKIWELNVQTFQSAVEDSLESSQKAIKAQSESDTTAAITAATQPIGNRLSGYQQGLSQILADATQHLAKTAEAHAPETLKAATQLAEEVKRKATEASQNAIQRQHESLGNLTSAVTKQFTPGSSQTEQRSDGQQFQGGQSSGSRQSSAS